MIASYDKEMVIYNFSCTPYASSKRFECFELVPWTGHDDGHVQDEGVDKYHAQHQP